MDRIALQRLGYNYDEDSGLLEAAEITGNLIIPRRIFGTFIKHIGHYTFAKRDLESVVIPQGILSLGDGAFSSNRIVKLEVPGTVKSIGRFCFNANKLEVVYLAEGVETIGQEAFGVNYYLRKIFIPPSVVAIAEDAFYDTTDYFEVVCVEDSYAHNFMKDQAKIKLVTLEEYEESAIAL